MGAPQTKGDIITDSPARDIQDSVLDALYDAAAGIETWSEALASLTREMQSDAIQLVFVDKTSGRLLRSEQPTSGLDDAVIDGTFEHVREWHRHDPHMVHAASLPVGNVMNTADSFPTERYASHPFYREYWAAYGVHALVAAKLAENDREVVMLAVTRLHPSPPFNSADTELFERYATHLVRAFRIAQRLQIRNTEAAIGASLMQSSNRAMVLLERHGRIVMRNAATDTLLGTSHDVVYVDKGFLRCRSPTAMSELMQALIGSESQVPLLPGTQGQARVALRLAARPPSSKKLFCSLWRLNPESTMGVFGSRPTVLLTIVAPDDSSGLDPVFLGSMFNLTPAEARIAAALLKGGSLRSIALAQRVSLETVRAQLRAIFEKTRTNRQSELILLLHRVMEN